MPEPTPEYTEPAKRILDDKPPVTPLNTPLVNDDTRLGSENLAPRVDEPTLVIPIAPESHPVLFVFACLFGIGAIYALAGATALVGGDIWLANTGGSEPGWGSVFAVYIFGPITLCLGLIAFFLARSYKKRSHKKSRPIFIISVVVGGLIFGIQLTTTGLEYAQNGREEEINFRLWDATKSVDTYSQKHNNALPPVEAVLASDEKNVTYRVIDQKDSIYELCATFETNTLEDYDLDTARKISTDEAMTDNEDYQIFFTHAKGKQCYKMKAPTYIMRNGYLVREAPY
ncbi:MAG: hypothetical protein ACOH18_03675 [Candidatus Saccharimonadaceae bacterium]